MKSNSLIDVHAILPASMMNGPGSRLVVFFQGCEKNCPGCFNPTTHALSSADAARLYNVKEILRKGIRADTAGITVSGGEPFLQRDGLFELLRLAKKTHSLTTVVYTGFTLEELLREKDICRIFDFIDVLIDGPFEEAKKEPTLLARGSTNQRFHFFNDTYGIEDFYMPGKMEITIGADGNIRQTGFDAVSLPL